MARHVVLLLLVLLTSGPCLAALGTGTTLALTRTSESQDLLAHGVLVHTDGSTADYRQILDLARQSAPQEPRTSEHMWLVLEVQNRTELSHWTIRAANPVLEEIRFYQLDAQQRLLSVEHTGRLVPAPPTTDIGYYLPLELAPGASKTLILYFKAPPLMPRLVADIMSTTEAQRDRVLRQFLTIGIFGIVAALVLYNALLGLLLRRDYYLWYTLHGTCLLLYFLTALGLMSRLFGIADPQLYLMPPAITAAMLFGLLFHYRFLQVAQLAPRLKPLFAVVAGGLALQLLLYPWLAASLPHTLARLSQLFYSPLILLSVILAIRQGFRPARYALLGWGVMIGVFLWASLALLGVFSFNAQIPLLAFLAVGFEMITLAMALGESIRLIQREKIQREAQLKANQLFIATLSHEIRNPLAALQGLIKLLQGSQLETTERQTLHQASDATRALMDTLDSLLGQFRQTPGRLDLHNRVFSLPELLESVVELYRPVAREKPLQLLTLLDTNLPAYLQGDPVRLRQVLVNLLGNAVKYSSKGSVTIETRAVEAPPGRVGIRFSVSDEGPGIGADEQHIFEPFQQLSRAAGEPMSGVGLGLTISQQIITAMGGQIHHRNRSPGGSEFYFNLHLLAAESTSAQHLGDIQHPTGLRILVVDDEPLSREVVRQLLLRDGQQVLLAENGSQALQRLTEQPVDVVLMDIQMPGMDGLQTTRRIRAHHAALLIIGITAGDLSEQRPAGLQAGMDEVLDRPLDHKALYRLVDASSDGAPAGPPLVDTALVARHRRIIGEADWQGLIQQFRQNAASYLAEVLTAAEQVDSTTLRHAAHRLAGAADSLGFARLAEAAGVLEQQAGEQTDPGAALDKLRETVARTLELIDAGNPSDKPLGEALPD